VARRGKMISPLPGWLAAAWMAVRGEGPSDISRTGGIDVVAHDHQARREWASQPGARMSATGGSALLQ
jgi:hypothetical protein